MRRFKIAKGQGTASPVPTEPEKRATVPDPENPPEDEEALEPPPRPVMTYLLTAINVVVFLMMKAIGHGNIESVSQMFGAKVNLLIQQGQWWRLVTPIFLHGSWPHLITNSLSLIWFGRSIEQVYGARKFLLIYIIAGVAGNITSYMHSPALSLGASGAIFGLVGAGLMFPIRFHKLLPKDAPNKILMQIVPIAAINLFIGAKTPSIDNWAHMGGLVGGALVALFIIPDVLIEKEPSRFRNALLTTMCLCAVMLTFLSGFKQWQWVERVYFGRLVSYPLGSPAWGQIGVPSDWKVVKNSIAWQGPRGTRLIVLDNAEDPRLVPELQVTSQRVNPNAKVDGRPAWQIRAKVGEETSDVFLVPTSDRVVEFIFSPSDYANVEYVNLLSRVIHSVHFVNPPASASTTPKPPTAP